MDSLEPVLAQVSLFEPLRPDEIGRLAKRFETMRLARGESRTFATTMDDARLVVVVEGECDLESGAGEERARARMQPGDRRGEASLVSGYARPFTIRATDEPVALATLDRAGFDAVLRELPVVALPLARELSTRVAVQNDAVRQLLELHAESLPAEEMRAAVRERRRVFARHSASVARLSPGAIFRRLIVQEGAEPPFWMLVGFIVSLGLARLVVFLILKYHLEQQLFALVKSGDDPNPEHVHHFNYGMILIGSAGLAALFPRSRRVLRVLAFAFGAGAGLVFDEFSLLWNLNPEYANPSSLIACGIAAAALLQLTYFRKFWGALARRAIYRMRGAR